MSSSAFVLRLLGKGGVGGVGRKTASATYRRCVRQRQIVTSAMAAAAASSSSSSVAPSVATANGETPRFSRSSTSEASSRIRGAANDNSLSRSAERRKHQQRGGGALFSSAARRGAGPETMATTTNTETTNRQQQRRRRRHEAQLFVRRQWNVGGSADREDAESHGTAGAAAASSEYSEYEYPLATEPPVITRTTAEQAKHRRQQQEPPSSPPPFLSPPLQDGGGGGDGRADPFDDGRIMSPEEREEIRRRLREELSTSLNASNPSMSPITGDVPSHIPPNVPSEQLEIPETVITTLDNGIRVVSQETYGQVSTIGVVSEMGSRYEVASNNETGVTNLVEALSFGTVSRYNAQQITELLQDWGGTRFVNTGREQSLHCIDLLRPNVENAVDLLRQVVLEPSFPSHEVDDAKRALEYQILDMPPELVLGEALQSAAYGPDQQLGQPHFVPSVPCLQDLTSRTVREYWSRHVVHNPRGMVVAAAGVRHDHLVDLAQKHFGHMQQLDDDDDQHNHRTPMIPSKYRGGEARKCTTTAAAAAAAAAAATTAAASSGDPTSGQQPMSMPPNDDGLVRIVLAMEVGGWHSNDLVPACVLQTLLGGGNSFSAGGPGKGMYSRLYRQVLNRYSWAESSEAVTSFHNESGLFGISGSTTPDKSRDMVQVLAEHMAKLALDDVDDEELDRARNMLKCNVLTQLESRLVLFEDLGRQVLTYDHRENMKTTCGKIDGVTKDDLRDLVRRAVSKPPTIASVGADLAGVPKYDEIVQWFRS